MGRYGIPVRAVRLQAFHIFAPHRRSMSGGASSYQALGDITSGGETLRSSSEERQRRRLCAIQVSVCK
jgi:hypothetical protein